MGLSASMGVKKVVDLTDQQFLIDRVRNKYVERRGLKYGWKSSSKLDYDQGHWNHRILQHKRPFTYDHSLMPMINRHPEVKYLWEHLQRIIGKRSLVRCYINGYTYGTDGYYHQDDGWLRDTYGPTANSETCIIYLNPEWDKDWGGETSIWDMEKQEVIASVIPKRNRLFIFDSSYWHAARPLSRVCRELRTVLVFKTGDPIIHNPILDWMVHNIPDTTHSGKTFFEHLYYTGLNTYRMTRDEDVAKAAFLHSVYGTEYFPEQKEFERSEIRELIGTYPEELVHEFCTLRNRYEVLMENKKEYPKKMWMDMLAIQCANMEDIAAPGRYDAYRAAYELYMNLKESKENEC
jgi:hypothetical protein